MKNRDKVIIKFKNRKQKNEVNFKQKELKSKGEDLLALPFGQLLFINDSMCFENQVLFYKYWQSKNTGKIIPNFLKIYHSCDLKNLLQVVNIDELIYNSSSYSYTLLSMV